MIDTKRFVGIGLKRVVALHLMPSTYAYMVRKMDLIEYKEGAYLVKVLFRTDILILVIV